MLYLCLFQLVAGKLGTCTHVFGTSIDICLSEMLPKTKLDHHLKTKSANTCSAIYM